MQRRRRRAPRRCRRATASHSPAFSEPEVHHHVELGGAGVDGDLRLVGLHRRLVRAAREPDDRGDADAHAQTLGDRQVRRRDAHRRHPEVGGLLAQRRRTSSAVASGLSSV